MRAILFAALMAICGSASAQSVDPAPQDDAARFARPSAAYTASISPNGRYVAFLRRFDLRSGVMLLDLETGQSTLLPVAAGREGYFQSLFWKSDERLVATMQGFSRRRGYFDRTMSFNRDGSAFVELGEFDAAAWVGARGELIDVLPADPAHVLVTRHADRRPGVTRVNVVTGERTEIADGAYMSYSFATDGAHYPVLRFDNSADEDGYRIFRRANGSTDWISAFDFAGTLPDGQFNFEASGPGENQVYAFARRQGFQNLFLYNTATGELGEPLQHRGDADATSPWINRHNNELIATCVYTSRQSCRMRDASMQRHLNAINAYFDNAVTLYWGNMSANGGRWLLYATGPREPGNWFVYEPATANLREILAAYPQVDPARLAPTRVVTYRARDGTELWMYVTGAERAGPAPVVVLPHNGPHARDYYDFDSWAQFFASRGYLVLQPNFRGSSGSGAAFQAAGRGQWGRRMQDDVTDALQHAIAAGWADARRVCIVGNGYGGYAALAGAALTPDLYRCAIAVSAITEPRDLLRAYTAEQRRSPTYRRAVLSAGTDRDALEAVSPLEQAEQIRAAVLLLDGWGGEAGYYIDHTERMERALLAANKEVRVVQIESNWDVEWWSQDQHATALRAMETFLAQHLRPAN